MRLPCDGALIVIDAGRDAAAPPEAAAALAALLAAWRGEDLPRFIVGRGPAGGPPVLDPATGDRRLGLAGADAFADGALEAALDEIGATTLVLCGAPTPGAVAASASGAAARGYRLFVVADACWGSESRDHGGQPGPDEAGRSLDLAPLAAGARIVTLPTALAAARLAKARQRLNAAKAARAPRT